MIARKGLALLSGWRRACRLWLWPGLGRAGSARDRGRGPAERGSSVKRPRPAARRPARRQAARRARQLLGRPQGRGVAADDKAEAGDAKAVALRVVAKGIHFLIGPYNSSVGLANLPLYRRKDVLPLWMTSIDATAGFGATVQPMNTQISPIEAGYVESVGAKHVAMLVDETANGAFTKGMAKRLRAALRGHGDTVTWTPVEEGKSRGYYAERVAKALSIKPELPM